MSLKEVMVVLDGDKVRIFADGPRGAGTADFTEGLAKSLGTIEERHKGVHGHHHHEDWRNTLQDHITEKGGGTPPHSHGHSHDH